GERVSRRTWGTMGLAATGVTLMLGGGLALGQLAGNVLALASAVSFACHVLVLRAKHQSDMLPAVLHAGLLGSLFALIALGLGGVSPRVPGRDLFLALTMGVVQLGGGLVLYTRASRYLRAAELQLIATAEMVLGPLWVWIGVGETPDAATLVGGTLVIGAILIQALTGREPAPAGGRGGRGAGPVTTAPPPVASRRAGHAARFAAGRPAARRRVARGPGDRTCGLRATASRPRARAGSREPADPTLVSAQCGRWTIGCPDRSQARIPPARFQTSR